MIPAAGVARARGFTLMEMLVVLVITALMMGSLFESLGILRRSQERLDLRTIAERRGQLALAWFNDSIESLVPLDDADFHGDASAWTANTLAPVAGGPGRPTPIGWSLHSTATGTVLAYRGPDARELDLARLAPGARFVFADEKGVLHETWPPRLGLFPDLPAAVGIRAGDGDAAQMLGYAAVLGPRQPYYAPFEPESDTE